MDIWVGVGIGLKLGVGTRVGVGVGLEVKGVEYETGEKQALSIGSLSAKQRNVKQNK